MAGVSEAALTAAILLVVLALFLSERVRHDLVALIGLFACLLTGLVSPTQALLGFADPAVIAVAAVLVVGRAIELTGVAAAITRIMVPPKAPFGVQLGALMMVGATLSAFMNNIAALVITMPLAAEIARRSRVSVAAVLMPLAFATILGGVTTLIGTPANLVLSSVREEQIGQPLSFFSMTEVGVAVTAVGLLYLTFIGWRLIPIRNQNARDWRPWRVYELLSPRAFDTMRPLLQALRSSGARLLCVFRGGERIGRRAPLRRGDRLLLLSRNSPWDVAERAGLEPSGDTREIPEAVTSRVVVAHGSFLIGQGYEAVRTRSGGQIHVVAGGPRLARLKRPLDTVVIEAGDQLFIRGPAAAIADLVSRGRLLEIDRFDSAPLKASKAVVTVALFVAAVAAAVLALAPPAIAFLGAAAAVAALRIIPPDEVYRSIDWPVIVLLAAMLPVGRAFEASGAADLAAAALGEALAGTSLFVTLAALCAGTLLLSVFLNNVATAVIMGPIAIDLSTILGVDPDAALLAVLVGASSDFLTPIGHQNNLLVMGPGGYRFTDYARVGAALALVTVLTAAFILSRG